VRTAFFAAFCGFEWSGDAGHVTVTHADTFTTAETAGNFTALVTWLSNRDAVAFFNHPGESDSDGQHSYNAAATPS